MKQKFQIQTYDLSWNDLYLKEKDKLTKVFSNNLQSIHHIGSTAIPKTKAKPEIDILLVVKDDAYISDYDKSIEALGYVVRGECLDSGGTPGRYYYSKDTNQVRTHKLHICQVGHPEIMAKLLFVKYLNEHQEAAIAYASLKTQLSNTYNYGQQIEKYLQGKTGFIDGVLQQARQEYADLSYADFL